MMNQRDDVMLTAYAVGELTGEDLAAVEARLADDLAARAEVDEIQQAADLLRSQLQGEDAPPLAASQKAAIAAGPRRRWLPMAAGLAAAAAVLVVAGILLFGLEDNDTTGRRVAGGGHPSGTPDPVGSQSPRDNGPDIPGDTIALEIALPAPMFKGTPKPIKGEPNMGPARKGKRPPFRAPRGTVNLALGKPVSSSDPEPIIGELKFATDGAKAGGDGYFVELAPGKQWFKIDLQQQATIYAITMWHYHAQGRAYRDVVIQISADEDFIDYVTVFNNDHDNSAGQGKGRDRVYIEDYQGKLVDCKGVQGRYVRLWSNENTTDESNHYIEVEVYGKPVTAETR